MTKIFKSKYMILNIILILFSIGMIYPWLLAISTSLKAPGETTQNPSLIPQHIDLGKFAEVFVTADMPRLALNSIIITGSTVILVLLLASLAAYGFARLDFAFKEVLFFTLLTGLMLQTTALM